MNIYALHSDVEMPELMVGVSKLHTQLCKGDQASTQCTAHIHIHCEIQTNSQAKDASNAQTCEKLMRKFVLSVEKFFTISSALCSERQSKMSNTFIHK